MRKNKTTKTEGFCRFRNPKRIYKRGTMEISVGAIVVLIMAITFLSLGLVFMKGMLGKMFSKFDEQIAQEPEPPKPTQSRPVTLSRNPIKAMEDTVEVIKISIMNPSEDDWISHQFIKKDGLCGKPDGICFINKYDTTLTCDTKKHAENNDPDCNYMIFPKCDPEDKDEKSCLISNSDDENLFCPMTPGTLPDADCEPREGINIYLTCDERIMDKPFHRNIGTIKSRDIKTSILLLRLKGKIPDDQYLCQIRVFAEDKEFMEDLVVRIENE